MALAESSLRSSASSLLTLSSTASASPEDYCYGKRLHFIASPGVHDDAPVRAAARASLSACAHMRRPAGLSTPGKRQPDPRGRQGNRLGDPRTGVRVRSLFPSPTVGRRQGL